MNKRRYPRAPVGQLIEYESDGQFFTANIQEISEGGARIEAPWAMPWHAQMTLALPVHVRDGKIAKCKILCDVVYRKGDNVGVTFRNLLPRDRLLIRDYVWQETL